MQESLHVKGEGKPDDCAGLPGLKNPNVQFLIALVPDPEATHLALAFDRHLEAIVEAAQEKGYSFARYWLPWRTDADPESSDPLVRQENEQEKKDREALPGLMVFRGVNAPLLAVFLVGETPTSGVDREQFRHAACYANKLGKDAGMVGILGPFFSGSFKSLDRAMADVKMSASTRIVSGTTTSRKLVQGFSGHDFRAAVEDDESAYCFLLEQFQGWERVAVLSEDGTGYGGGFEPECKRPIQIYYPIYYPREISRLRNAYQDDPALAAAQKLPDSPARRQLLLPLRDSLSGRDTLPQFSTAQTPATQETVLFQISESLKRQRIQATIVRGTNVLDTLFLSRFLRQCCGDMRVAVLDSDLLFVHGTDSLEYLGVLSVGSYPPRPHADELQPDAPKRVFGSNAAEGAYKAMERLLDPRGNGDPDLWISVVGRGAYSPVAAKSEPPPPQRLDPGYPSRLWDAVFYTGSLLALLYAVTYFYASYRWTQKRLPRWCSDFHPSPEEMRPKRAVYHLLTTMFLLAAYWALAFAPAYLAFVWRAPPWQWQGWLAIGTTVILLFVAADTARAPRWHAALVTIVLAILIFIGAYLLPAAPTPSFRLLFGVERSVDLASGTAPNLPLVMLFLALACWAWVNMQRLIFVEERDPGIPDVAALPKERIRHIVFPLEAAIFVGSWPRASGLTVVVIISGYLGSRWIGSLEWRGFDRVILVLLTVCAILLLSTGWAYLRVWRRLRRGLEALDLHPIRFAFAALPTVATWSPLWQPTARRRSYSVPERMVETTQMLESEASTYYADLANHLSRTQVQLKDLVKVSSGGLRESAIATRRMNFVQNCVAQRLAQKLDHSAWRKGSSATLKKIEKDQPKPPQSPRDLWDMLAAEAVAIRYVALIRYVMLHLRNQLSFMTVGFILLAVSLNCYSFEGEGYFRWWLTAIFLILSAVVIGVFVEMELDATLSHLTDTKTGKVDGSFYVKVLSAGVLPLLAVLSSQFPSIGRFLFSWLQPALSALH
jgi:hypothetical protein